MGAGRRMQGWCMVAVVALLLCSQPGLALDYTNLELFREGFDPNNLEALRDVGSNVRLPFRTDTNRYSDGKTSNAGISATSPSFPQYKGFLASPEGRHEGYLAYDASCAAQGIAKYGAGDAEKESAKKALLDMYPNATELANSQPPTTDFTVLASIKWNPSNFCVQKDEDYMVEVLGPQMWQDGGILVGPEGYESYYDATSNCYIALGRCRSHLRKKRRLPRAPWMSLACAVGEFVRPLGETDPGNPDAKINYLPLDEAVLQETIVSIGRSTYLPKVSFTGQLICFANDAHLNYWNNVGSIDVRVTRASWPPTSELFYEPLRRPACDSASMVYKHQGNYTAGAEYCNVDGGGAGWRPEDVTNEGSRYGSAVDQSFYLPAVVERTTVRPDYITFTSPYESMF